MKLIINASIMISGVVVIDVNGDEGKVSVVHDKDFTWTVCQVQPEEGDDPGVNLAGDQDLRNVAVLRLIAAAHARAQAKTEETLQVIPVSPDPPKKGEAN